MSLTEISVRVAVVTVLALSALIAIGWRRPAQDYSRRVSQMGAHSASEALVDTGSTTSDTANDSEGIGRATLRKVLDVVGLGSIATFIGIIVALVVSTGIAWMVTALLSRL